MKTLIVALVIACACIAWAEQNGPIVYDQYGGWAPTGQVFQVPPQVSGEDTLAKLYRERDEQAVKESQARLDKTLSADSQQNQGKE